MADQHHGGLDKAGGRPGAQDGTDQHLAQQRVQTPQRDGPRGASLAHRGSVEYLVRRVLDQQGQGQVRKQPRSRQPLVTGLQAVDAEPGLQALERELDLPSEPIRGQRLSGAGGRSGH